MVNEIYHFTLRYLSPKHNLKTLVDGMNKLQTLGTHDAYFRVKNIFYYQIENEIVKIDAIDPPNKSKHI